MMLLLHRERQLINTTIPLDYDLSNVPGVRAVTLNISVNDTVFIDFLTVNIDVVDVNDNSPMFRSNSYK